MKNPYLVCGNCQKSYNKKSALCCMLPFKYNHGILDVSEWQKADNCKGFKLRKLKERLV